MKFAKDGTLKDAIEHYAVLFNRPAWLDPDRLDLQVRVWWGLVEHYGEDQPGAVSIKDFRQAMVAPTGAGERDSREVLPAGIVRDAVGYAAARAEAARLRMWYAPEQTIYNEETWLRSALDAADGDVSARTEALAAFQRSLRTAITQLVESGLNPNDVSTTIARIKDRERQVVELVASRTAAITA